MAFGRDASNEYDFKPFDALVEAGGWYAFPKNSQGEMGHLVGYTKRDELGRQLVGGEYANFVKVEENIDIVLDSAISLRSKIPKSLLSSCDIICGIPEGGKTLATMLAHVCHKKFKYPDKRITPSKIPGEREVSTFVFGRHKIREGREVILVEDVTSGFSSVQKVLEQIDKNGSFVTAIATFFNRSTEWNDFYYSKTDKRCIPIISLIRRGIRQYRQDDPLVSDEVKKGNVVWDPKNNWEQLVPQNC